MPKDVRFRTEKYTTKIITEDLYKDWIKENNEYSNITFKEFKSLWKLLSNKYVDTIVNTSHGVNLSGSMGEMSLKYVDIQIKVKNYGKSREIGEDVGMLNLITSGKYGKVVWSVDHARKLNNMLPLLGFEACRDLTIKAGIAFKETPELYKKSKTTGRNRRVKTYNKNNL